MTRCRTALMVAGALALAGCDEAYDSTADQSCHNVVRDGRNGASAVVSIDLDVRASDWPRLKSLLGDYARDQQMQVRDTSHESAFYGRAPEPVVGQVLELSLCREPGLTWTLRDDDYDRTRTGETGPRQTPRLALFETGRETGWEAAAADLASRLDQAWPGKVTYYRFDPAQGMRQQPLERRRKPVRAP